MSLADQLQTWGIGRQTEVLQEQIREELDFHIESRVDELVESGMTIGEARHQANHEFGDRRQYARQCQRVHTRMQTLVQRLSLAGLAFSLATIGFLGWNLLEMKNVNSDLSNRLSAALASLNPVSIQYDQDVKGAVIGHDGKPLANARVVMIHKSWPGGRYMQRAYATTTDDEGRYLFEDQYSSSMRNAFHISIIADEHVLTYQYQVTGRGDLADEYKFEMQKASSTVLKFVTEDGQPRANTDVFVHGYQRDGTDGSIYHIAQGSATWQTDDDGELNLSIFAAGDQVELVIDPDGQKTTVKFKVADETNAMEPQVLRVGAPDIRDYQGIVKDADGNSVAGAKVVLIHKSWPGGRYTQSPYATTTNDKGEYLFPKRYMASMQNAFHVAVFAEGHQLVYQYAVFEEGQKVSDFEFELEPATSTKFRFVDDDGEPLVNAQVFVSERKSDEEECSIYWISRNDATWQTDDDGVVSLPFFTAGDEVGLEVAVDENFKLTFKVEETTRDELQTVTVNAASGATKTAAPRRQQPKASKNNANHVQWIKDNAVEFSSVDPNDTFFADLEKLKELIGDARIVQLGEQSHGDGICFETKIRLIKFLHQEMGFDVLAFESGLYDCHKAWQAFKNDKPPLKAASQGVFGIWTGSAQTEEMWNYLADQANGENPLELVGFDCQFTAGASRKLRDELADLSDKLDGAGFSDDEWAAFDKSLKRLVSSEKPGQSKEDFLAALKKLADAVANADESKVAKSDARFWKQQFVSMADHCSRQFEDPEVMQNVMGRDEQMARNLIWLAKERYPDRKIIVWAASFHIMRNPPGIVSISGSVDYSDMIQMGHRVHEALGDEVYTIGFTAYEGKAGAYFRPSFDFGTAPEGTLESLCMAAGLENGFVPLRGTKESAPWLHEEMHSRPMGYSWMRAKWPNHFDAMIFNKTMQPSTR